MDRFVTLVFDPNDGTTTTVDSANPEPRTCVEPDGALGAFRAGWMYAWGLADVHVTVEVLPERTEDEIADAALAAMRRADELAAAVRRAITSTARRMLERPVVLPEPRPMVDTDGWPPVARPGGERPAALPSTAAMMRALT